jgi:2-succinyl-6-hydroxy-2,4-cyclohexadiene-1-carboxylate synthase
MQLIINEVRYHLCQAGSGEPVFLLHGFTGSYRSWERLIATGPLVDSRKLFLDLPGHGRTESPRSPARYHIHHLATDMVRLADHLRIDRFGLMGYSMGGRLALYTALEHPARVRWLVLESASPGLATEQERRERRLQDEALAQRIEDEGVAPFVARWEALPLWESQRRLGSDVRSALREQRLANDPVGLANSLRGLGTGAQPSLWARLHELSMPVLLVTGDDDHKFTALAARMCQANPRLQRLAFAEAGHAVHLEQPVALGAGISAFVRRVQGQETSA